MNSEVTFSPSTLDTSNTASELVIKTPSVKKQRSTPKSKNTCSPKSDFGYDDAYTGGDSTFLVRKPKNVTRRRDSNQTGFARAKQSSLLAPTKATAVKQRNKATSNAIISSPGASRRKDKGDNSLTIPVSPRFTALRPTVGKEEQLTSEDLLLKKLEQEKADEAQRIRKAQRLYEAMKSGRRSSRLLKSRTGSAVKAAKAKASRTFKQPRAFHYLNNTVSSASSSVALPSKNSTSSGKVSFTLHSKSTTAIKKGPSGLTLVEPFKFATNRRFATQAAANASSRNNKTGKAAATDAELAQKFMMNPRSEGAPATAAQKLTIASSPVLRTQKRSTQQQAVKAKHRTREEIEAAEMEEIAKHPFRARKLDRRIFQTAGELGVPKVTARPVTEPVEFQLQVEKRSSNRVRASSAAAAWNASAASNGGGPRGGFKAKPVPASSKSTGSKKTGVPKAASVSASARPSSTTAGSSRPASSYLAPTAASKTKTSAPVIPQKRQDKLAGKQQNVSKKPTEPKAFQFATSSRGNQKQQRLQQQMQQEEAAIAAAREVKAQPVPDYARMAATLGGCNKHVKATPLTEPKPFHLRSTVRHEVAASAFQQEVASAMKADAAPAEFRARPLPRTTYVPATPTTAAGAPVGASASAATSSLVIPLPVQLQSEVRAQKRAEFDQGMEQRMSRLEEMQQSISKQKAERESLEIKQLRAKPIEEGGMTFKAKPILTADHYPPAPVAAAPPTTPFSPQLRTKARSAFKASLVQPPPPPMTAAAATQRKQPSNAATTSIARKKEVVFSASTLSPAVLQPQQSQHQQLSNIVTANNSIISANNSCEKRESPAAGASKMCTRSSKKLLITQQALGSSGTAAVTSSSGGSVNDAQLAQALSAM